MVLPRMLSLLLLLTLALSNDSYCACTTTTDTTSTTSLDCTRDVVWTAIVRTGEENSNEDYWTYRYGSSSEENQVADLYIPQQYYHNAGSAKEPASLPVVVLVHGGYWRHKYGRATPNGSDMRPLVQDLLEDGTDFYAVVNVEYRRVGSDGGVPETLQDVVQAVDALACHPQLDVTRVAVVGHSAGGHLALWRTLLPNDDSGIILGYQTPVVQPIAAVGLAPVTDFHAACSNEEGDRITNCEAIQAFLSAGSYNYWRKNMMLSNSSPEVSPVDMIRAKYEALMDDINTTIHLALVHGTHDDTVHPQQSARFVTHADESSTHCSSNLLHATLYNADGEDHFDVINPDSASWQSFVKPFLRRVLKPTPATRTKIARQRQELFKYSRLPLLFRQWARQLWTQVCSWIKVMHQIILPIFGPPEVTAWIVSIPPLPPQQVARVRTIMTAKPPPTSKFDLDAIEAFEAQLEQDQDDADVELEDDVELANPTESVLTWTIDTDSTAIGKRLDAAVASLAQVTRSMAGPWIANGHVTVDGTVVTRKATKLETDQVLTVHVPTETAIPTYIQAQDDLPLEILYEDEIMIVLNKAAGMVVHPAVGNWKGTVVNALAHYLPHQSPYGPGDLITAPLSEKMMGKDACQNIATNTSNAPDFWRPGIVHRLDKGTTGVLVVAKTKSALTALAADFAARRMEKTYLAISIGNPGSKVVIDKPIARHPIHRQRMRVVPNPHKHGVLPEDIILPSSGKRALSFVDTLAFDGKLGLVQVKIATGRTHQIRVHLADRKTPLYGDDVYGRPDWNRRLQQSHGIERPLLHAFRLGMHHPVSGEFMVFEAPLPPDMQSLAQSICGPEGLPSFLESSPYKQ